jgi:hypothetical protein
MCVIVSVVLFIRFDSCLNALALSLKTKGASMLLARYEQNHCFFNMNFSETCSEKDKSAYRGELILIEGEVGDSQGRRKPPSLVLKQAVVLAGPEKLLLVAGSLDDLLDLPTLVDKYGSDFDAQTRLVLFVVNVAEPLEVKIGEAVCYLVPLPDGMAWNELIDLVALEKGDFKGQSAANKVLTVYNAMADFKPKYKSATLEEALALRNDAKREARGPV